MIIPDDKWSKKLERDMWFQLFWHLLVEDLEEIELDIAELGEHRLQLSAGDILAIADKMVEDIQQNKGIQ